MYTSGFPQNPYNPYSTPSSHYPQRMPANYEMNYSPAPKFETSTFIKYYFS